MDPIRDPAALNHHDRAHSVVVVGAGILGAAVAFELAARGHRVTVIDEQAEAPSASDAAFGWVTRAGSAAAGPARSIPELDRALADTRALLGRLDPSPWASWSGAASWAETAQETRARIAQSRSGMQLMPSGARSLTLPGLRSQASPIAWAADEAILDAAQYRSAMLDQAVALGATLRPGRVLRVTPLPLNSYRVREESGAAVECDSLVLACGAGIPKLAAQLGGSVAIDSSPAARFTFTAPDLGVTAVVSTPQFEIRPDGIGRFVAAEDVVAGEPEETTVMRARASLTAVRKAFGLAATPEPEALTIGWRPIPAGRALVCEALPDHPGALVLAAHPGITLAATLALRVADWAADRAHVS